MQRAIPSVTTAVASALAAVFVAAALGEESSPSARASAASAEATAWLRDGAEGYVSVSGNGRRTGSGTAVSASTRGGRGSARASARATGVNLFDGLVTASAVTVRASASNGRAVRSGHVSNLRIEGDSAGSPSGPTTENLNGYGTLYILQGDSGGIVGLRAVLRRDYRGNPAGASALVAFAAASARDAPREERRRPERPDRRPPATQREDSSASPADAGKPIDRPVARRRAPRLARLRGTGGGYVFPVHGKVSFSDDWGAPRQHTGRHQGTDIFAPQGRPVLAVRDGILYTVGARAIPGNRLWLRDRRGDTFFYAHLSAFAHNARNGARVKAGDVIGFAGSTGDAEQTPPHLHFEIHPNDGPAVNPYPFLRAWQERRDVPRAAWLAQYASDPGARPGTLVMVRDYIADG